MRVIVLGGTWFVGRAITEALTAAGHSVLVAHRGISEPPDPYPRSAHPRRTQHLVRAQGGRCRIAG